METVFAISISIVLLVSLTWLLIPALYGLPPISTNPKRIRKALQLADLKPNETLYDLGCGHGQVLVIATKEFGGNAVGIDVGPVQCVISWLNAFRNGVSSKVKIEAGNFFKSDLSQVDVIFAYLTSEYAERLEKKLKAELKTNAKVITVAFELPNWEVLEFDRELLIRVYKK